MITDSALVALAGLAAVVALLFLLITRYKWHVFLALLVPIVLGSVLAEALKNTGGIERITASMIRWVGEARMPSLA